MNRSLPPANLTEEDLDRVLTHEVVEPEYRRLYVAIIYHKYCIRESLSVPELSELLGINEGLVKYYRKRAIKVIWNRVRSATEQYQWFRDKLGKDRLTWELFGQFVVGTNWDIVWEKLQRKVDEDTLSGLRRPRMATAKMERPRA